MQSLLANKISGGYSWTLTTRLGEMLRLAQEAYGPKDNTYTTLGIEFELNGPQIWYPGNCKHIAIQLTPDTANDQIKGCYQLAHECIHLLSPSGRREATTLEEGLATWFAHQYVEKEFNFKMPITLQSYETARQLIGELLAIDKKAIKKLRTKEFTISNITSQLIIEFFPECSTATAQALGEPFVR